jgi:hypothetical protein
MVINMALPPKPNAAPATESVAPVAATPVTAAAPAATGKVPLKRFGAARIGEGDAAVLVATPKAAGLDLVELQKQLYNTFTNYVQTAGVAIDAVLDFCAGADKANFPGHKDGRIAYATAGTVNSMAKIHGLITKVRGQGGGAAMKKKIEEKDIKIKELEAKLAQILAQMGK